VVATDHAEFRLCFHRFWVLVSSKTERATKRSLFAISFASAVTLLLFLVAAILSPPFLEFPSVGVVDEYFRAGNLVLLMYII
jgi:hypothetical protein